MLNESICYLIQSNTITFTLKPLLGFETETSLWRCIIFGQTTC